MRGRHHLRSCKTSRRAAVFYPKAERRRGSRGYTPPQAALNDSPGLLVCALHSSPLEFSSMLQNTETPRLESFSLVYFCIPVQPALWLNSKISQGSRRELPPAAVLYHSEGASKLKVKTTVVYPQRCQ